MKNYKIEDTITEEKETFIHIDNFDKTVELYTTDYKILNRMKKKIGEPTSVFPPVREKSNSNYIWVSGASWKYKYEENRNREKLKQIFSITNLLPRKKDSSN